MEAADSFDLSATLDGVASQETVNFKSSMIRVEIETAGLAISSPFRSESQKTRWVLFDGISFFINGETRNY
jgi:hypothetical protein